MGTMSSSMAASSPPSSATTMGTNNRRPLGLVKNLINNRHSFIQLFAMSGILLLSLRSLGQKYRIHQLEEDTFALKEERQTVTDRTNNIKCGLLDEASKEPTGVFTSRLRLLFGED